MNNGYLYVKQETELEYQIDKNILLKIKNIDNQFGNGKYSINTVGAEILQLIDGSRTYEDVIDYLALKYKEDSSSIEKKVEPFLVKLRKDYGLEIMKGEKSDRKITVKYNNNNYPRVATLELTNVCNLRCIHCYGSFGECEENVIMPFQDVCKILREFKDMGVLVVELTGGEITMHPQFNDIIKFALALDFNRISLLTNGVSLQKDTIDLIIENKDRIYIQIDFQSFHDDYLEWFTKRKNTLESITHNIEILAANKVPMRIATMVTKKNISELLGIADWIYGLGIKTWGIGLVMALGRATEYDENLMFADEENPEFVEILNRVDEKYPRFISYIEDVRAKRINCGVISSHIVIGCDGRTKICAMDTGEYFNSSLGNVTETPLSQIYKYNKDYIHLFGILQAPSYNSELCSECKHKFFCHGCLLRAFIKAKEMGTQCQWYTKSVDDNIKYKMEI